MKDLVPENTQHLSQGAQVILVSSSLRQLDLVAGFVALRWLCGAAGSGNSVDTARLVLVVRMLVPRLVVERGAEHDGHRALRHSVDVGEGEQPLATAAISTGNS